MAAAVYTLVFEQGATWSATIRFEQPRGTPYPLPGFSGQMQVRAAYDDPAILLDLTEGDGITTDQAGGIISIAVPADQTGAFTLPPMSGRVQVSGKWVLPLGFYDLTISNTDGVVERILEGQAYLDPGVTK